MITVAEFAKRNNITEQSVYYLIKKGKIGYYRFGKSYVLVEDERTMNYRSNPKRKNCGRRASK